MNVYEIDDGEQWWYAAQSKDDALRLHLEPMVRPGTDLTDLSKVDVRNLPCSIAEMVVSEISSETILPVQMDEELISKTAAEWASEGCGLIACTVY
jgi:hypothetical protein